MAMPREIVTGRLVLRPFAPGDEAGLSEILSDWEVTRWLSTNVPFPFTIQDAEQMIATRTKDWDAGTGASYGVFDRQGGDQLGGMRIFALQGVSEVGYWLGRSAWGKGYGTEILKAVVEACFTFSPLQEIVAQTAEENIGSQRILEKAGFSRAGETPAEFARCGHEQGCSAFYRLKKDDWQKEYRISNE